MTLDQLLHEQMNEIVAEAQAAVICARLDNYRKAGEAQIHQRLKALAVLTARGVKERNIGPMVAHAQTIAKERFDAGFDLAEVQTAINVLEEVIWKRILRSMQPIDFAEALGLVSTALGTAKDALARTYVELASKTKAPSLNLESLFSGTGGM